MNKRNPYRVSRIEYVLIKNCGVNRSWLNFNFFILNYMFLNV